MHNNDSSMRNHSFIVESLLFILFTIACFIFGSRVSDYRSWLGIVIEVTLGLLTSFLWKKNKYLCIPVILLAFFAAPFSLFIFNGNPQNTTIEVMWLIYLCPIGCISLYRYESRHKLELEEARKYKLQRIKDVESPVIATLIVNKIIMWGFTSIEYSIWFLKDSMLFVRVINWWEPIGRSQGDEIGVLYESKMIDEWINRLNGTPKVILQIRRGSFEIAYGKTTKIKITLPQLRTLGDTTYHTTGILLIETDFKKKQRFEIAQTNKIDELIEILSTLLPDKLEVIV